jgi:hypothetical protein
MPVTANFTGGNFSVVAWVRAHTCHERSPFLFCRDKQSKDELEVVISTSAGSCMPSVRVGRLGDAGVWAHVTAHTAYAFPSGCGGGAWFHLAVSLRGERVQVYVNGRHVIMNGQVYSPIGFQHLKCSFGSRYGRNADADFDEIKFFNRSLSSAEIESDYNCVQSFVYKL